MTSETPSTNSGIAVALSSAFFGFYTHSAFLAALHEEGIFPDEVAGTSSGALVALANGTGLRNRALVDFFLRPGMRSCFWDWLAPLRLPGVASSLYSSGILSGKNAVAYLRKELGDIRIENLREPHVQFAVTNMTRRECVMVREGDAAEFAIASCAIPGLICNQIINGERWCDGGVAMHVPFEHWLDDPAIHTIIIHRVEHIEGTELVTSWPTLASGFATCHQIIANTTTALRRANAKRSGKRIIEIVTETAHPRLFPTKQRTGLMHSGADSGKLVVNELRKTDAEKFVTILSRQTTA